MKQPAQGRASTQGAGPASEVSMMGTTGGRHRSVGLHFQVEPGVAAGGGGEAVVDDAARGATRPGVVVAVGFHAVGPGPELAAVVGDDGEAHGVDPDVGHALVVVQPDPPVVVAALDDLVAALLRVGPADLGDHGEVGERVVIASLEVEAEVVVGVAVAVLVLVVVAAVVFLLSGVADFHVGFTVAGLVLVAVLVVAVHQLVQVVVHAVVAVPDLVGQTDGGLLDDVVAAVLVVAIDDAVPVVVDVVGAAQPGLGLCGPVVPVAAVGLAGEHGRVAVVVVVGVVVVPVAVVAAGGGEDAEGEPAGEQAQARRSHRTVLSDASPRKWETQVMESHAPGTSPGHCTAKVGSVLREVDRSALVPLFRSSVVVPELALQGQKCSLK